MFLPSKNIRVFKHFVFLCVFLSSKNICVFGRICFSGLVFGRISVCGCVLTCVFRKICIYGKIVFRRMCFWFVFLFFYPPKSFVFVKSYLYGKCFSRPNLCFFGNILCFTVFTQNLLWKILCFLKYFCVYGCFCYPKSFFWDDSLFWGELVFL